MLQLYFLIEIFSVADHITVGHKEETAINPDKTDNKNSILGELEKGSRFRELENQMTVNIGVNVFFPFFYTLCAIQ